jgi:hypothetical protein
VRPVLALDPVEPPRTCQAPALPPDRVGLAPVPAVPGQALDPVEPPLACRAQALRLDPAARVPALAASAWGPHNRTD